MKKLFFPAIAALAFGFVACTQENATLEVKANLGDVSKYITVEDKSIEIYLTEEKEDTTEYKVISATLNCKVSEDLVCAGTLYLSGDVYDKDNKLVATLSDFEIAVADDKTDHKYADLYPYVLKAGDVKAELKMKGKASKWTKDDDEVWKNIKEASYIEVKADEEWPFKAIKDLPAEDDTTDATSDDKKDSTAKSEPVPTEFTGMENAM